uniref:Uncharacterized protein n=1 Tax=Ditylenchus dipsaci TaxID=166011 RepID=A0A915DFL3_9BILA
MWLPALLCFYAILKEIKVGEPYMYKYQTEYLNITAEQLTSVIYPANLHLPHLVGAYLLAHRPTSLQPTMLSESSDRSGVYGIASASEIAFFSYIYARLEKDQYRKLTSWTRAGTMAGRTFGYFVLSILNPNCHGNLRTLNIIAFSSLETMVGRMLEAKGREIKTSSSANSPNYLTHIRDI